MKYIILIFAIFIFNNTEAENLNKSKQNPSEIKIEQLSKKVEKLEENSYSKDIIQEYKDLNNIYGIGFGILIGLFGVVFPLLLYVVQIKPSQDVLKEAKQLIKKVDEDFEKSFEEHLKKRKNKLIDQAIEGFANQTEQSLPTNYTLLDSYKSEGFTEIQVIKLLKLLKREDIDESNKSFFASILTFQEDENIENYFVELLKQDSKNEKCIWGAIYFANYEKTQYYDLIAKIVINGYSLTGMISSLSHSSKKFAVQLLNNELLIKELPEIEIKNYGDYGIKYITEKMNSEIIEDTLFWKKYIQLK
jgi:hypothetical protein